MKHADLLEASQGGIVHYKSHPFLVLVQKLKLDTKLAQKLSPHQEKTALLLKLKAEKYLCMFGYMRWSVSFDLIPYLRQMSVK